MTERDPTQEELDQREPADLQAVPVRIEGPVRSQQLPAQTWAAKTIELTDDETIRVLNRDPRRKRAYLLSNDGATWIGASQAGTLNVGFRLPDGGLDGLGLELTHSEEVWAVADGNTSNLRMVVEYWAE